MDYDTELTAGWCEDGVGGMLGKLTILTLKCLIVLLEWVLWTSNGFLEKVVAT